MMLYSAYYGVSVHILKVSMMENQSNQCAKRIGLAVAVVALGLSVMGGLTIAYRLFVEGYLMK